jgi:hypothetical protein
MYLQKVISKKLNKKLVFCWHLGKVNDENSRIRIRIDPNPDPLVRGMDPRIQIQIHPKMSWIRNSVLNNRKSFLTLATLDRPGTCHTAQSQESGEHRLPFLGRGKFCFLYSYIF